MRGEPRQLRLAGGEEAVLRRENLGSWGEFTGRSIRSDVQFLFARRFDFLVGFPICGRSKFNGVE